MIEGLLLPQLDECSAPFFEYAERGELRVQRCDGCGLRRMPPRPMCPSCGSFDSSWEAMSGDGTVWSVAIPHPPLLPAYSAMAPYNVVVVALDDDPGIRLVGNVVAGPDADLDSVDPHSLQIGALVRVVFPPAVDDGNGPIVLPRWVLRDVRSGAPPSG